VGGSRICDSIQAGIPSLCTDSILGRVAPKLACESRRLAAKFVAKPGAVDGVLT
jgi:hypothetical protein